VGVSIFEELREQVDLAALAARYTDLQPSGRALVGCCPNPDHDDEHPSFYVYPDARFFCYGCRWRGDVTDLHAGVQGLKPGIEAALHWPGSTVWIPRRRAQKPRKKPNDAISKRPSI
jgi:DNA primase